MTQPDRNKVQQAAVATQPARLSAIPHVRVSDPALQQFIDAVRERLEVREGSRGNPFERVVTLRDLQAIGLDVTALRGRPALAGGQPGGVLVQTGPGTYRALAMDQFADAIRKTRLFGDLMKGLKDPTRFDALPSRVQQILLADIAAEAAKRGADIRRLEHRIQSATESFAARVEEVTAALGQSLAGVRQTVFANATATEAAAGVITQVRAAVGDPDSFTGRGVTLEETLFGTADAEGLYGQYTVKIDAGGKVAGIGLAVDAPVDGPVESAFLVSADKFAIVSPAYSGGLTETPPDTAIPFGVDTATGQVFIRGQLLIEGTGTTVGELLAGADGIFLSVTSEIFKLSSAGVPSPASVSIAATLGGSLTGYVTWSAGAGFTGALPAPGTTNTIVVAASELSTDAVAFTATLVDGAEIYTDVVTLVKLRDGADTIVAVLTNENHTIPAAPDGTPTFDGAGGTMRVYRGTTLLTSGVTFSIASNPDNLVGSISGAGDFNFTGAGDWPAAARASKVTLRATVGGVHFDKEFTLTKSIAGADGDDGVNGVNAYSLSIGATSQVFRVAKAGTATPAAITLAARQRNLELLGPITYTFTASPAVTLTGAGASRTLTYANMGAAESVTVTVTAEAGAETLSDSITIVKVREGADAVVGLLSNETHTLAADASGIVSSYSGASGQFTVQRGGVDVTGSSAFSVVGHSGFSTAPTASIASTGAYAVTGSGTGGVISPSANVATVTYRASHTFGGVTSTVDKTFTITKARAGSTGPAGQRGTVNVSREVTLTSWGPAANTAAALALSELGFGVPMERDQVTLVNTAAKWAETRFFTGGVWSTIALYVGGNVLVDGTVAMSKMTAGRAVVTSGSGEVGMGVTLPSWSGDSLSVALGAARHTSDRPAFVVTDNSPSAPASGSYWLVDMITRANGLRIDFGQGVTGFESVGLRIDGRGRNAIYMESSYVDAGIRVINTGGVSAAANGNGISVACTRESGNGSALVASVSGFGSAVLANSAKGPGVEGYSGVSNGAVFGGNAARGALRLVPRADLPTSREMGTFHAGSDGNLYWANGVHWFRVGGLVQVT